VLLLFAIPLGFWLMFVRVSGDGRCEGGNKKRSQIHEWTRKEVRVYNLSHWVQKQCAYLAQGRHHTRIDDLFCIALVLVLAPSSYESSIPFCLGHMHRGQTPTNLFFSPCKKE
jgi:hypothetical protein